MGREWCVRREGCALAYTMPVDSDWRVGKQPWSQRRRALILGALQREPPSAIVRLQDSHYGACVLARCMQLTQTVDRLEVSL